MPEDIYEEHLERDGEADHVIDGGDPDNPLGHYRLSLSMPEYGLHGTNVPWGVGMNISHGCVRLYPEDIERLFYKAKVGTPGRFVYQPVKFGWRGDSLYVEVHDDLYGEYPGALESCLARSGTARPRGRCRYVQAREGGRSEERNADLCDAWSGSRNSPTPHGPDEASSSSLLTGIDSVIITSGRFC